MKRRLECRRGIRAGWRLAAVPVVVPCAGLLLGCGGGPHPAPPLPARAAPSAVVRAYVAALNSHDTVGARQLMTPEWADVVARQVDGWFTNVVRIKDLHVGRPRVDRAVGSARRHRFVLYVPVTFDLTQRQESSMRDGPTTWGYVLVQDRPSARWLIDGDGVG